MHSIRYYEFDNPIVSDSMFDSNSRQLVELQSEMTEEELNRTRYGYCMKGFDGSTGFDLYGRLKPKDREYLRMIANSLG